MKKIFCLTLGVIFMLAASAGAKSIRTPEGNFPRVQWAVVESTEGTMPQIAEMGARILASNTAKESGTYALYGAIERDNPNLMRLLEIYERTKLTEFIQQARHFNSIAPNVCRFLRV